MNSIDWDSLHGYDAWAQALDGLLQNASAAATQAARDAAKQSLTQFRDRVPGYGDDLSELARQAVNSLLLSDMGASLQQLAQVQQQLHDLQQGTVSLASFHLTPLATSHALQEAASWLLRATGPPAKRRTAKHTPREHQHHMHQALERFLAAYPAATKPPARSKSTIRKKATGP